MVLIDRDGTEWDVCRDIVYVEAGSYLSHRLKLEESAFYLQEDSWSLNTCQQMSKNRFTLLKCNYTCPRYDDGMCRKLHAAVEQDHICYLNP